MLTERPPGFDPANDHESQVAKVMAVAVVFASLSTVFTGLRLFTRMRILGIFCADDWAISCAQIISVASSVLMVLQAHYALGRHIWVVTEEESWMQIRILYSVIIGYNLGMNVVKIGFLLLYLRIFHSTSLRVVIHWFLGYVVLWAVTQVIVLALSCVPLGIIAPNMADKCIDTYPAWLTSSIMSTVTDFVIFALPLREVIKLRLRMKQKIITVLMFSLGFFTCIISIVRIFTLRGAITARDPTWDNVGPGCWSIIELNCAILCSNLPTLRPFVARYFPSFGLSSANASRRAVYRRYGGIDIPGADGGHRPTVTTTIKSGGPSQATDEGDGEDDRGGGGVGRNESTENLRGARADDIEMAGGTGVPAGQRGQIMVTTETVISDEHHGGQTQDPRHSYLNLGAEAGR